MTLFPGTKLGPYKIVSQLGSGGMGVVYEAKDPRLKRTVAVKLLPPDLTKDATAKQRFLQEAQAASALDHPNICTIFEINETEDGQLYLVMAHYAGETLKERIERGPLELDDAVDIATQVGTGLAKAHAAGIVHRDIKPANLMVTGEGVVKILDFGLAKLTGTEGVTQTGTTVGTVAYMSPEQARGQEVDHRTDIWSLGVVLYEMLAGTPPFQGDNLLSLADAIRSGEPEPLRGEAASALGPVSRALSKDTDGRYTSATDLVNDLKRGVTTAAPAVAAHADIPSVAVLPFTNMSADPEQTYFCDGLAEDLIDGLAQLQGLRVVARTSSFRFRGEDVDLREVGRTLNVKTVLEGSVRRSGDRLRVTAQLINADDGYHLWSERYDRTMDDVFEVQDEIAQSVVEKLKVKLLPGIESLVKPQENVEAYQWFLRGRHVVLRGTVESQTQAIDYFDRALAEQPDYAEALAGKAWTFGWQCVVNGLAPPTVLMPKAKEAVLRALELDDSAAMAHFVRAEVSLFYDWDWSGAEREYRRATSLNSGLALAHANFAMFLGLMGRGEESVASAEQAVTLDPIGPHAHRQLAMALCSAGRYRDAERQAQRTLELEPGFVPAYWELATVYAELAEPGNVLETAEKGLAHAPDHPVLLSWYGWASGKTGQRAQAESVIAQLEQRRRNGYFSAALIAGCHLGLGELDHAVRLMRVAADERDSQVLFTGRSWYEELRPDARFRELLQRINLPHLSVEAEGYRNQTNVVTGQVTAASAADETVAGGAPDGTPSIAVLPFADMSPQKDQEYFCDGLSEELIDALARLEGLRVVARTSAFQFRGKGHDLREVGQKLKVKTVLEGSVRKAGNRLRVNAQLINTEDGYHLWSERYDRTLDDVFAIQDDIASSVVDALKVKLMGRDAPLVQREVDDLTAYNLFLKGRYFISRFTESAIEQGLGYFNEALAKEPGYARAHAGIALTHGLRGWLSLEPPRSAMTVANAAVQQAMSADEMLDDAHHAAAYQLFMYEWDWEAAEHESLVTLQLNPNHALGLGFHGWMLACLGRGEEAIRFAQRSVHCDPLSTRAIHILAGTHIAAGRFKQAIDEERKALELNPSFVGAYWVLGICDMGLGRLEQAIESVRHGLQIAPADVQCQALLAEALGLAGQSDEALRHIRQLEARRRSRFTSPVCISFGYAGLGRLDEAMHWLETAYEERDPLLVMLNAGPYFDQVRGHPRFQALLRKMNFPEAH